MMQHHNHKHNWSKVIPNFEGYKRYCRSGCSYFEYFDEEGKFKFAVDLNNVNTPLIDYKPEKKQLTKEEMLRG